MKRISTNDTAIKISALMKNSSISVKEISEVCSVTHAAVYKWLSGGAIPDIENLRRLADYFGLEYIEEILVFDEI